MNKIKYAIDTVALLRYLTGTLPSKADNIFQLVERKSSKIELIVPSIVIGELIYIIEKGKKINGKVIPKEEIDIILSTIFTNHIFAVTELNRLGWNLLRESTIPELHDRMIVATSIQENVNALLTSDREIKESEEVKVIW